MQEFYLTLFVGAQICFYNNHILILVQVTFSTKDLAEMHNKLKIALFLLVVFYNYQLLLKMYT